jgi:tRNA(fMet)-specific endonuclease VapC
MILLDTDHFSILVDQSHSKFAALRACMQRSGDQEFVTSIVSIEEQLRGWLAEIRRQQIATNQPYAYRRLADLIRFVSLWRALPFDTAAATDFVSMRQQRVRIGTQDLKIAAIARTNDVLLLSANLRDFQQVPGLRVEDWLTA